MSELPTKFEDLDAKELYRSAVADFALPVEEGDGKKVLLAAFVEGGVLWDDYVSQHPEVSPEPLPAANLTIGNEVSVEPQEKWADDDRNKEAAVPSIRVASPPVINPNEQWLIKMERKNPLFEVRGHRFTQENPYALVSPKDAQYILSKEDGFRQAFPDELEEFYG